MKNEKDCGAPCLVKGLKLATVVLIVIGIWYVMSGCTSTKEGCINPKKFEKFNNSRFNK